MNYSSALMADPSALERSGESPWLDHHLFDLTAEHGHEQVSFASDEESGYRGIIAIHNTVLGPALGGTRFWNYRSDAEALTGVLRLSRGMTFKAAMAGLKLGGGKSVILGDPGTGDREAIMRAHGRHIEFLAGRYVTGEDVGTSPSDMEWIRKETKHVVGLREMSGDPSPATALGVFLGMKACAMFRYGNESLASKRVALQGCGHVGYYLARHLNDVGAKLIVSDIDGSKVKRCQDEFEAVAVPPDQIYGVEADIFAPCALGAVINDKSLKALKVDIVAGSANNQLAEERHGDLIEEAGIVYAPDYVINAGGVINVFSEIAGWDLEETRRKVSEIFDTVSHVLRISRQQRIPTHRAADRLAQRRIEEAARGGAGVDSAA
jgi:leucine dehydrogenase